MPKTTKKTSQDIINAAGVLDDMNTVHALSYFPFFIGPVAMYFLGKTDKKKAMHHIKYALIMAIGVVILFLLLNEFSSRIVTLIYLGASAYFAYKAYTGEIIKIDIFDTVEQKFNEKVKK